MHVVLLLCSDADDNVNYTYTTQCTDASKLSTVSFLPVYQEQLAHMIRSSAGFKGEDYWSPLKGFKIVINAGNGMGGFIKDLVEDLGANTDGSLYLEPDGTFPNHLANPE
eukprot:6901-Heterococcus_DN1.PRE.1